MGWAVSIQRRQLPNTSEWCFSCGNPQVQGPPVTGGFCLTIKSGDSAHRGLLHALQSEPAGKGLIGAPTRTSSRDVTTFIKAGCGTILCLLANTHFMDGRRQGLALMVNLCFGNLQPLSTTTLIPFIHIPVDRIWFDVFSSRTPYESIIDPYPCLCFSGLSHVLKLLFHLPKLLPCSLDQRNLFQPTEVFTLTYPENWAWPLQPLPASRPGPHLCPASWLYNSEHYVPQNGLPGLEGELKQARMAGTLPFPQGVLLPVAGALPSTGSNKRCQKKYRKPS